MSLLTSDVDKIKLILDAFLYEMNESNKRSVALPREPRYWSLKLMTIQIRKSVTSMA